MKLRALFWYLIFVFGVVVAGIMFLAMRTNSLPDKQPNAITITVEDKEYDGSPITVTATSTSGAVPTIKYKVAGADDSTLSTDAPINAGNYIVVATTLEEWNYAEAVKTATFTIKSKEVLVSWQAPQNLVYNGQPKVPTCTVSGVLSGDDCSVNIDVTTNNNNVKVGSFTNAAVIIAIEYTSIALHPRERSLIGALSPNRIGP